MPTVATFKKADLNRYRFDFGAVFDNLECRRWYAEYLKKVKCEESILFVEAVEKYESLKSDKNRFVEAKKIVEEFIKPTTAHEINIDDEVRMTILKKFDTSTESGKVVTEENCPRNLFETVAFKIYCDLKSDTFKRFLESEIFASHLNAKLKRDSNFLHEIARETDGSTPSTPVPSGDYSSASASISGKTNDSFIAESSKKSREAITSTINSIGRTIEKEDSDEHSVCSDDKPQKSNLSDEIAKLDQLFSLDKIVGSTPCITQTDYDKLIHLVYGGDSLWKSITKKPERGLYTSKKKFSFGGSSRKIKAYKETGTVPFAAEHVVKLLSERQLIFYTESLLCQYDPIDYIPYDKTSAADVFPMNIAYLKFKFAPPLQKRDFLLATSTVYDEKKQRYFSIRKSCEHPKKSLEESKKSKCIRASYFGGFCIEQIDSFSSRYTVAAVADMGGWIPLPVWNQLISLRDDSFHNGLLKALAMKKERETLDKIEDNAMRAFDTIEENKQRMLNEHHH